MKLRYVLSLLFVASLIVTACGGAGGGGGPVKVALLAPMSGQVKTFGESTRNGVDLAVAEWNTAGGVTGLNAGGSVSTTTYLCVTDALKVVENVLPPSALLRIAVAISL